MWYVFAILPLAYLVSLFGLIIYDSRKHRQEMRGMDRESRNREQ